MGCDMKLGKGPGSSWFPKRRIVVMCALLGFQVIPGTDHPVDAQGPRPVGIQAPAQRVQSLEATRFVFAGDSVKHSHWKAGMAIGGITGLLIGNALRTAPCESSHCSLSTLEWVASIGSFAILGGMIGSLFH